MKRILSVLLALVMMLALAPQASAESVQKALEAASSMSNEELYAKAKEEIAAGAQLNF